MSKVHRRTYFVRYRERSSVTNNRLNSLENKTSTYQDMFAFHYTVDLKKKFKEKIIISYISIVYKFNN